MPSWNAASASPPTRPGRAFLSPAFWRAARTYEARAAASATPRPRPWSSPGLAGFETPLSQLRGRERGRARTRATGRREGLALDVAPALQDHGRVAGKRGRQGAQDADGVAAAGSAPARGDRSHERSRWSQLGADIHVLVAGHREPLAGAHLDHRAPAHRDGREARAEAAARGV